MILGSIEQLALYFPQLDSVAGFVLGLGDSIPDGRHEIESESIFALVSRYQTKPEAGAMPEAHRRYADIQLLLNGREQIVWWPLASLVERIPYDNTRDIAFYDQPLESGTRVILSPVVFAAFMPQDAHMPQIALPGASWNVTKVVIKVDIRLLDPLAATS